MPTVLKLFLLDYKEAIQAIQVSLNIFRSGQGKQKYDWTLVNIKA